MDRDLYKAKRTDNGEWIEWNAFSGLYGIDLDKDTICQCTGMKDKNGKLIFKNDIAKDESGSLYKVVWQDNYYQFSWVCTKSNIFPVGAKWDLWRFKSDEVEVIGNVFDNPDLL